MKNLESRLTKEENYGRGIWGAFVHRNVVLKHVLDGGWRGRQNKNDAFSPIGGVNRTNRDLLHELKTRPWGENEKSSNANDRSKTRPANHIRGPFTMQGLDIRL